MWLFTDEAVEVPEELLNDQTKTLLFWVIYEDALEFPGQFVVRRHLSVMEERGMSNGVEMGPWKVTESLELARASIPDDCYPLGRSDDDVPQIVEVWIR